MCTRICAKAQIEHDGGGVAGALDRAGHHQEERDDGQDHREDEAGHVVAVGAVRGAGFVVRRMGVVGVLGAHLRTPSR